MHTIAIAATLAAAGALATTPAVAAEPPDNPSCLGVVTAQRAVAHHDIGEHASGQEEPRLGLGNVADLLLGDGAHVSDLGTLLGQIDENDATHCP